MDGLYRLLAFSFPPAAIDRVASMVVAAVLVLGLTLNPGDACAEDGPYANYQIGDRALGLAGAFVGLADDPSASFHNPAGLATLPTGSLSGSLWVVTTRRRVIDDGYGTDFGTADLVFSENTSLPFFLVGVVRLGSGRRKGSARHALAASILTPQSNDYNYAVDLETGGPSGTAALFDIRREERSRWYGLSYAYRLTPELSLGVSAFWASTSITHSETEALAQRGPIADVPPDGFLTRKTTTELGTDKLVVRLGGLYKISPRWRLGIMFQPPGFTLSSSAEIQDFRDRVEATGTGEFQSQTRDSLDGETFLPWELRLGASWSARLPFTATIDLSLLGPAGTASDPVELVDAPVGAPSPGLFFPLRSYRRLAFRGATGAEFVVQDTVPVRIGLLAELSSAPEIPATSNVYLRDDLDHFGASVSVGYQGHGYDISLGVTGALGSGQGLAARRSRDGAPPTYVATDVSDRRVFFFLAGGARTAARVAREIVN